MRALRVIVAIAAFALVGSAFSRPIHAQQADDDERLRDLVAQLLGPTGVGPNGERITADILLGALPASPPVPVPVPPDGRVVGSVVRSADGRVVGVTAVLDVPGAADDVIGFYDQAYAAAGYRPAPGLVPGSQGGFQPTAQPLFRGFCAGPQGPWVTVSVATPTSGPNDVRVSGDRLNAGPCQGPGLAFGGGGPSLPRLTAPPGVIIRPGGPYGVPVPVFPGLPTSDAIAITDMGVAELEAAFAGQLAAAGWTRLAGGVDGPLAWSRWAVPGDGERRGFLYVLEGPGSRQRTLHLDVATPPSE